MNSSIRPYYHQKWIIIFGIVCHSTLILSCRSSVKHTSYNKESINKILDPNTKTIDWKIISFSEYLLVYYHQKFSINELNFIIEKWMEFDQYNNLFSNPLIKEKEKYTYPQKDNQKNCSNDVNVIAKQKENHQKTFEFQKINSAMHPSLSFLQNVIESRKETNLIVNIRSENRKKKNDKSNLKNSRIFSKFEAYMASNATNLFLTPNHEACGIQKAAFCMSKYFSFQQENNDLHSFYPPSVTVNRCSQGQCLCLQENHECLPNSTKSREHYVIGVDHKHIPWTWAFFFTEHSSCQCKPSCFSRKCIAPFLLKMVSNENSMQSCECLCPSGKERKCKAILSGQTRFSSSDYFCIISGKCVKPQCLYNQLTEEDLYNRRCPING